MNLKVPTLPLSIPIQVPIGGLLMMSMTSPLCRKHANTEVESCQSVWDPWRQTWMMDVAPIPSAWGSRSRMDSGWSRCARGRGHRRVRGKAARPPRRPPTSRSLCCCWRSLWCPPSDHLRQKPQRGEWFTVKPQLQSWEKEELFSFVLRCCRSERRVKHSQV